MIRARRPLLQGRGGSGQLGIGTSVNFPTPKLVANVSLTAVAVGKVAVCAVTSSSPSNWTIGAQPPTPPQPKLASCWGTNGYGQFGDNTATGRTQTPVTTTAPTYKAMSVSETTVCVIDTLDVLSCWGDSNVNGKLGNGATGAESYTPTPVTGAATWADVYATGTYTCGIQTNGSLFCWGFQDAGGQLGLGTATQMSKAIPTIVRANATWASLPVRGFSGKHTCAIQSDGSLWCWGPNTVGQLGDGTLVTRTSPTLVALPGAMWTKVTVGIEHTCAIHSNATLWCWVRLLCSCCELRCEELVW